MGEDAQIADRAAELPCPKRMNRQEKTMSHCFRASWLAVSLIVFAWTAQANALDPAAIADLHGGLVVQLGAADVDAVAALSRSGRYLIHVLEPKSERVAAAQDRLRATGHYGLAWVESWDQLDRLPYAENLVNLILVCDLAAPAEELLRVLAPGGTLVVTQQELVPRDLLEKAGFVCRSETGGVLVARKPRPEQMDSWSHPRHAADGNAVSHDSLVGPPERIRWIAAATSEVEGLVTAGGRNFYGGILARDSFNGLRLWHRDLKQGSAVDPQVFELPRLSRDGARPIASDALLFAVMDNRPVALDPKTGDVAVRYGDLVNPTALIHQGERVIVADSESLRAFDAVQGDEIWSVASPDPRNIVADDRFVAFLQGRIRRGDKVGVVVVKADTGSLVWQHDDYPWLARTARTVLGNGLLVFEASTLNDHDAGNGIHVVAADTGRHHWSKEYPPGMNHNRQARAMFLDDDLWILHGGKLNTSDPDALRREPVRISALDPATGQTRVTFPAGLTHCFPPVATANYMFAGEMDLTNLKSGQVIANRITKANCSRENGWVPANGLIYTTPKHCTCWPMLRGFVALAPAAQADSVADLPTAQIEFPLETGPAQIDPALPDPQPHDWPLYRHDRWRSASTPAAGPERLESLWSIQLGSMRGSPAGPILHDWNDNPVVKGPVSAPTIANGIVYVARPDAHELVAVDSSSGHVRWRFTANGRVDTPPAIHRGLCLFGSASGWVYALRADTGKVVWRLRAAPTDERIVACGQLESAWPVPGAVLVIDDIAYFAAGRQPLAEGGILVFAVDPLTGQQHWVHRIDSVPQQGFYENSGLEFDPFDILHAEGDGLTLSRWILSRDGTRVSVDKWNAFAKLNTGGGEVWVPRGSWSYGARHQHRFPGEAPRRPLVAFRDDNVYSSLNGTTTVFRRDFDLEQGENFDGRWITGWEAAQRARENGKPYRTYRIAEGAEWFQDPFTDPQIEQAEIRPGTQLHNRIHAMALAGNGKLFAIHEDGRLRVLSAADGSVLDEALVPPPAWDALAIAGGRLFLATQDGSLLCLGDRSP
jgi:outer membrane protein assembly factor BamB